MVAMASRHDDERERGEAALDHAIARRAKAQHGLVSLRQLVELGLSPSGVRSRVARARLRRVHRGIYATGHAELTRVGRLLAAVLACGRGAAASHRACAELHELRLRRGRRIDVTAPGRRGRGRPGIRVHDAATLHDDDLTEIDGVPCTTLARTLLDLAESATRRELERACDRAAVLRTLDMAAVDAVLERANGRRGAGVLRAVLREHGAGSTLTRSELEERFLSLCRATGNTPETVNLWVPFAAGGGAEADFAWPSRRLIAEVDGRDPHAARLSFEHDRRRDQQLMVLGWRVVRFTWRQVHDEPRDVVGALRALLDPLTMPEPAGRALLDPLALPEPVGRALLDPRAMPEPAGRALLDPVALPEPADRAQAARS